MELMFEFGGNDLDLGWVRKMLGLLGSGNDEIQNGYGVLYLNWVIKTTLIKG